MAKVAAVAAPMSVRKIIVNADDFGIHPSVNEGIERAHREGIVTSASVMVLGDAFDDALIRMRRLETLDLGLHFSLTGVRGFAPTLSAFAIEMGRRGFSTGWIEDALRRQLDLAVGKHRLALSHIDSHQHVHALPTVMRILCAVAPEYGIRAVRVPRELRHEAAVPWHRKTKAAALSSAIRFSGQEVPRAGLRTTDHFCGMFWSGHLTTEALARYLMRAKPGVTEIICHPGSDNRAVQRTFGWGYDGEGELAAVCDPSIRDRLNKGPLHLMSWRDI